MNRILRRILSLGLSMTLMTSLAVPVLASDALGEDLTGRDTLLNEGTELSTNVFWSSAYSDLRTENLVTYEPNRDVTPIVTYGGALTDRSTVSAMAKQLEAEGYRVVAGFNGDFYNVNTGLPIGMVVTEGILRSSDAGYHAIGFRKDGSAVLGKPGLKVTAELGYKSGSTEVVRQVMGVNKARVSTGGIYLYTCDFNAKHTTGTTEAGIDVICSVEKGDLAIGETVKLTVERVAETAVSTPIGEDQMVLSVNLKSDAYHVDALRNIPAGSEITLKIAASDEDWEDVEYAVGALYSLVENGREVSGLAAEVNPRTAVGQKRDGTLVFYTVDGRKPGHSIGASLSQVARRMIELGCETALCLDGGGSTTLSVTKPDETAAKTCNVPSDGVERAVSNQIFLVASSKSTGKLSRFYVRPDHDYVLAGSRVNISAAAIDTNHIPMDRSCDLTVSGGSLNGTVLTTPAEGGEITVTASSGSKRGSATVYAIADPDEIVVRNSSGVAIKELEVAPGTETKLTASTVYKHLPLHADAEAFAWEVKGDVGSIDEQGNFIAGSTGDGRIVVTAGEQSVEIDVTVTRLPLKTVEDFEEEHTIFDGATSDTIRFALDDGTETVRMGYASGKLEYTLSPENTFTAEWLADETTRINSSLYTSLNLWIYGDGSRNILNLLVSDGHHDRLPYEITRLDFTGWQLVTIPVEEGEFEIRGLQVVTGDIAYMDDGQGGIAEVYPEKPSSGTVYLDQIVASFGNAVDSTVPEITAELDAEEWAVKAEIYDAVDGVPAEEQISVTYNGGETAFEYDRKSGEVTVALPASGESYEAMRVTITARDASGNIGRASVDVEPRGVDHKFTDIGSYWGATYVDFLYNSGVTTGYADGSFRPGQNITRAQFAVMLYRYLGLEEADYAHVSLPFADNGKIADYAVPAIKALYTEGIINGSTGKDGKLYFNPNSSLTRAQAATMIGRTQEKGYDSVELTFTDAGKIPAYARFYIQTMAAQGIIGGYTDGSFKPNNNITRGQMAKILYNLM